MAREFEGPGTISVSGGRTSALMLRRMMDAGALSNPDLHVVFANTGREREETLQFVRDIEVNWGVKIWWLEYIEHQPRFRWTNFENASRRGEPFEALLRLFVLGFCFVLLGEQMEDADVAAYESRARAEIEAGR